VINESKRLLATLEELASEELASATSGDEAHHEPTTIPIGATSAGIRTLREANRSALSVHIRQQGTRFGWTVYGPAQQVFASGNRS
jgi:hypothetical protein